MPDVSPAGSDPFAPLPGVIAARPEDRPKPPAEVWEPRLPAPGEPPEAGQIRHMKLGTASARWVYRDPAGQPEFAVARFEKQAADGTPDKELLPYTFGRRIWTTKGGKTRDQTAWHFKRPGARVSLYGLERLAARLDAPVLVVEGEKTADRAATVFPDLVPVTSQGGCKAGGVGDWSPVAGRHVLIWPDNDEPGSGYAKKVANLAIEAGAATVRIVAVPKELPEGWDLGDELPEGVAPETLAAMLAAAQPVEAEAQSEPAPEAEAEPVSPEVRVKEIDRLSRLPGIEYAAERKPAAQQLRLTVAALDHAVKAERAKRRAAAAAEERARPGPGSGEVRWPFGFVMQADGLYADTGSEDGLIWVCPPFNVLGEGRDASGEGWGLWLTWQDGDGRVHKWHMPNRMLMVGPGEMEGALVDQGLRVSPEPGARAMLRVALGGVRTGSRVTLVAHPGWHAPAGGDAAFVLPNNEVIGESCEPLVLKTQAENAAHAMAQKGTLAGWKTEVAARAVGNPIPAFMISAAFAGPLLEPAEEISGGFHFVARSKVGKTLSLRMALSVSGSTSTAGLLRSWRNTANAMEAAAEECSDNVLPMDEIHQADPREVVGGIYQFANEVGKGRLQRNAAAQRRRTWRSFMLSTGELTVAAIAAKAGQPLPAGADVRLPSINVDSTSMWPNLHGRASAEDLMRQLQGAILRHHGTAIRPFLESLAAARNDADSALGEAVEMARSSMANKLPKGADQQVRDVARRCALVAAAGEFAAEWEILPWQRGEATRAAETVLDLWLGRRGDTGSAEESQHVRIVRAFLVENGASRFATLVRASIIGVTGATANKWVERSPERPVVQRAGWRRAHSETSDQADSAADQETCDEYLISQDGWTELCSKAGADPGEVAKTLKAAGFLTPGENGNLAKKERVPGLGTARFYVVNSGIFGDPTAPEPNSAAMGKDGAA
jgi:putative DNA primase/helicase